MVFAIGGAVSDVRSSRIPNSLTCSGMALGIAAQTWAHGYRGLYQGLSGLLTGGGVFFLFYLMHTMGGGDVKLMAAIGAWLGVKLTIIATLASAIAGGVLAVAYMVLYRRVWRTVRNIGKLVWFHVTSGIRPHPELNLEDPGAVRIPYGVAIAIGTLYLLFSTGNS